MKSLLLCKFIILLICCKGSYAQNTARNLFIGIDVSKNIPAILTDKYFFQKSFIIESSIAFPLNNNRLYLNIVTSYSSVGAYPVFKNLDYHNQGFFLKGGIDYFLLPEFSFGSAAVVAAYDEFGRYILEGPYYGSLVFPFKSRRVFVAGIENHIAFRFAFNKRWYIHPIIRGCLFNNTNKLQPDSYYVPGIGATSRDINEKHSLNLSGGFSINVQYSIPL